MICRRNYMRTVGVASVILWLFALSGCTSMQTETGGIFPWSSKEKEKPVPDRVVVVWTDTILHQPGQPGMRGFGGRLHFYDGDKKDPIEVDGGLAVYVFDADATDSRSAPPERKFVFTADQFANHMSKSPMGMSYSIWLPWDEVGGLSRRLSIITRFEGRNGGVVISQPSLKLLPGVSNRVSVTRSVRGTTVTRNPIDPSQTLMNADRSAIAQVGFDQPFAALADPAPVRNSIGGRQIETIELPPSFIDRNLRGSNPQIDSPQDPANWATVEPDRLTDTSTSAEGTNARMAPETAAPRTRETHESPNAARRIEPLSRRFPARAHGAIVPRTTVLRTEPFQGGWIDSLPKTPRYANSNDKIPLESSGQGN